MAKGTMKLKTETRVALDDWLNTQGAVLIRTESFDPNRGEMEWWSVGRNQPHPIIMLVQTYADGGGFDVFVPATDAIDLASTLKAVEMRIA